MQNDLCRKKLPPSDGSSPIVTRPSTAQSIVVQEKDSNPLPVAQNATQVPLKEFNTSTLMKESSGNQSTGTAGNLLSGTTNVPQSGNIGQALDKPLEKLPNSVQEAKQEISKNVVQ